MLRFFCYEKLGEAAKCLDAISFEVDILCYNLAFFSFRRLILISRREVLKTSYSILFIVLKLISEPFCTILKRLIGSVPIGEGPGDVAQ